MTTQTPKTPSTRAEAKAMMLAALAGETVNSAVLSPLGTCRYNTTNFDGQPSSCIVGILMTPEMRVKIERNGMNGLHISSLIKAHSHPCATALTDIGLTEPELSQLQRYFDQHARTDLITFINQMPD